MSETKYIAKKSPHSREASKFICDLLLSDKSPCRKEFTTPQALGSHRNANVHKLNSGKKADYANNILVLEVPLGEKTFDENKNQWVISLNYYAPDGYIIDKIVPSQYARPAPNSSRMREWYQITLIKKGVSR